MVAGGTDTGNVIASIALSTLGTSIEAHAPLMSAGLDSLGAAEFANAVSVRMSVAVAPTELFDHPTLDSIASYILGELACGDVAATGGEEAMEVYT